MRYLLLLLLGCALVAPSAFAQLEISNQGRKLCQAARSGNLATVRQLLKQGTPVEARDENGWTPLIHAVAARRAPVCELLLKHGANPNVRSRSDTGSILMAFAAGAGDLQIVQMLVKAGANPNLRGLDGHSALSAACANGRRTVAGFLLKNGAKPNTYGGVEAGTGLQATPLRAAASRGDFELVRLLVDNGAKANFAPYESAEQSTLLAVSGWASNRLVKALVRAGANPNVMGGPRDTPLARAVRAGNGPVVQTLLVHGADLEAPANTGLETLADELGFFELAAVLREAR